MTATALRTIIVLVVSALALGACGGDDDDATTTTTDTTPSTEVDGSGSGSDDADSAGSSSLAEQATAELKIVMKNMGGKGSMLPIPNGMACTRSIPATCRAEMSCPAAEEESDLVDVCSWLTTDGEQILRTPTADDQACTMQYGGRELLQISGTINGTPLSHEDSSRGAGSPKRPGAVVISRTNGCEIARFDSLSPLFEGMLPTPVDEQTNDDPGDVTLDQDRSVSNAPKPDVIDDPPEAFGH
ncbi:MAG: hypothetical protein ABI200_08055 [Gaiellales bacterium]